MPHTTPVHALRYPDTADSVTVAAYIANLANDVDAALPNPSGITQSGTAGWATDNALYTVNASWTQIDGASGFAGSGTTPITIPTGLGGRYDIAASMYLQPIQAAARGFMQIMLTGPVPSGFRTFYRSSFGLGETDTTVSVPSLLLPAGVGIQVGVYANASGAGKTVQVQVSAYQS